MRTVIRDLNTGLFYSPDGQWTWNRGDARDFCGLTYARKFAGDRGLRGVEAVLISGNPEYDVRISLEWKANR